MQLISQGKFEEIKREHNIEFEIKDNHLVFNEPEFNSPFNIELASNSMHIASFINQPEGTEIGYFIYNQKADRNDLIYMYFDKNMKFKSIYVGDA